VPPDELQYKTANHKENRRDRRLAVNQPTNSARFVSSPDITKVAPISLAFQRCKATESGRIREF
jgi:hypothetical protein